MTTILDLCLADHETVGVSGDLAVRVELRTRATEDGEETLEVWGSEPNESGRRQ